MMMKIIAHNTLGERLKYERSRIKLTQVKLAKVGGVACSAQSRYELNITSPDARYLNKIRAVGVDVFYVLCGDTPPENYAEAEIGIIDPVAAITVTSELEAKLGQTDLDIYTWVSTLNRSQLAATTAYLINKTLSTGSRTADNNTDNRCDKNT